MTPLEDGRSRLARSEVLPPAMAMDLATGLPKLKGDALAAVKHRGCHLQIIASAGSGKTEVVAQRVADLFADGVEPHALVAFTFTERAADELRRRIEQRAKARMGQEFLDHLNGCFIGTIHAYCLQLLQSHVPRYETYDVLDEHRLAAFLARESNFIKIKELNGGALFKSIKVFMANVEVVENELINSNKLTEPFRSAYERFQERLDAYRFLTYGQLIARAVDELRKPEVFRRCAHQVAPPHRRRISGHQPCSGGLDRATGAPASGTMRGRRRRSVHLSVARFGCEQHCYIPIALPEGGAFRNLCQQTQPANDHQHGQ